MFATASVDGVVEDMIVAILQQEKRMKPVDLLSQLEQQRVEEEKAREVISDLIDRNVVLFDADWKLKLNPLLIIA